MPPQSLAKGPALPWKWAVVASVVRLAAPTSASYTLRMSMGGARNVGSGRFAIVLLLLPTAALAQVEKRIALLIGNQAYADAVGPLQNAHKDIALVGRALTDWPLVPIDEPLTTSAKKCSIYRSKCSAASVSDTLWAEVFGTQQPSPVAEALSPAAGCAS